MLRKSLAFIVALLVATTTGVFAAGGAETTTADPAAIPEIHHYEAQTNAAGAELGSNPDVVKAVQEYIVSQIGIRPVNHYLSAQDYNTALNLALSSGEQIDWFHVGNWTDYHTKNIIQPVNDYLKYAPTLVKNWPQPSWDAATDSKGTIWAIPRATATTPWYVHIRADWLDRLGLSMPKTVTEMETVMAEFKKAKLNGDSTTVLLFSNGPSGLLNTFVGNWVQYGNSMWLDANGKVQPVVLAAGFRDYVETMARWYRLGYLDQESFVNAGAARSRYQQLQPGIFAGWYSHVTISDQILKTTAPDADYQIAPLMSPQGKGIMSINGAKPLNGAVFHKNNVDMEATMKLIDWFFLSETNYLVGEWGLEGQQWKWVDREKGIYEPIGDRVFFNDFRYSVGLPMEAKIMALGGFVMHNEYLRNKLLQYDMAVFPWDTKYNWDQTALRDNVPAMSDLNRLMDEEITKFVMGARPLSEWDAFVKQLSDAGLAQWVNEYTRQYNQLK